MKFRWTKFIEKIFQDTVNDVDHPAEIEIGEDEDIAVVLNKYYQDLPLWIIQKGVKFLDVVLLDITKAEITKAYKNDPKTWWAAYHHGWGTNIRNSLRDNVCRDDELPSKNWDDYYVQLVEVACGLRNF